MSEIRTITLPEAEDMLRRLKSVNDESSLVEEFYPLILKSAGEEEDSAGIVILLQMAIVGYTQNMSLATIANLILQMEVPRYIQALVDDEAMREDTIKIHKETSP